MLLCVPHFTTCMLAPGFEKIKLGPARAFFFFLKKKREREYELGVKYKSPYLVQKDLSHCWLSAFIRFTLGLTMQKKKFRFLGNM